MLTEQKKKNLCYLLYPKIQAQMVSELEAKTRLLSDLALISITQMYIEEHLAAKKQNKKEKQNQKTEEYLANRKISVLDSCGGGQQPIQERDGEISSGVRSVV
jgi:Cu/Ag efflux pump CusA